MNIGLRTIMVMAIAAFMSLMVGQTVDVADDVQENEPEDTRTALADDEVEKTDTGELGSTRGTDRVVLAELFTATWCTYCPYAEAALHDLHEEYEGQLAILEWHTSDSDPYSTPEGEGRFDWYFPPRTGIPQCVFDGTEKEGGGGDSTYDNYKGNQWWRPCDHQSQQDVFIVRSKKDTAKYDVFELVATVSGADQRLLRTCVEVGMNPNKPDRAGLKQ